MKSGRGNRFLSVVFSIIMIIGVISVGGERVLAEKDATTGLLYTITGEVAEIIGFSAPTGFDGNLSIPSTIGGKSVTSIANSAFAWNDKLTSLSIPNKTALIERSEEIKTDCGMESDLSFREFGEHS